MHKISSSIHYHVDRSVQYLLFHYRGRNHHVIYTRYIFIILFDFERFCLFSATPWSSLVPNGLYESSWPHEFPLCSYCTEELVFIDQVHSFIFSVYVTFRMTCTSGVRCREARIASSFCVSYRKLRNSTWSQKHAKKNVWIQCKHRTCASQLIFTPFLYALRAQLGCSLSLRPPGKAQKSLFLPDCYNKFPIKYVYLFIDEMPPHEGVHVTPSKLLMLMLWIIQKTAKCNKYCNNDL